MDPLRWHLFFKANSIETGDENKTKKKNHHFSLEENISGR